MQIRQATPSDAQTIHDMIVALATFEREPDAVEVTVVQLAEQLAETSPPFECIIASSAGRDVGFALYFYNYSTWRGARGLYLEDLFVLPECRGRGYGKQLMTHLARRAVDRGCARMEWAVLDWNRDAMDFYEAIGAGPVHEWVPFRMADEALVRLAAED